MAEDKDERAEEQSGNVGAHIAAAALALGPASRAKADAFLDQQTRLARRQEEEFAREESVRHRSLRIRHVSDVLKLGFELAAVFIVLVIAVGLGGAIWSAVNADGLLIESFNVPADMELKGLTGQVVANKLLDRLTSMQDATNSARARSTFANDWTNDIKVQIPDTGVSLGQVVRYLHDTLGHEMHLAGEMYETPAGLALTVRLDSEAGQTFEGKDLGSVIEQAAEATYRRAQPYRYSIYLRNRGRTQEATALDESLAENGTATDRAWANTALAIQLGNARHYKEASALVARAIADAPDLSTAWSLQTEIEIAQGHDENALAGARKSVEVGRGAGRREFNPTFGRWYPQYFESTVDEELGDYRDAIEATRKVEEINPEFARLRIVVDAVLLHDFGFANTQLAGSSPMRPHISIITNPRVDTYDARADIAIDRKNWPTAVHALEDGAKAADSFAASSNGVLNAVAYRNTVNGPRLAYADAMMGERAKSEAILRTLPPDCYMCTRMRGRIEAATGSWGAAAYWFADAVKEAPSIPFAYVDWGEMLLAKGDLDGAIEKFKIASQKGPHFADPLEMWGDVLIRENRSDLAIAKFEEANKYAPNWGRLHLKWGEALLWSGDKAGAAKQFAIAGTLDLSPFDKSKLAKVSHG
jgi:tetratricopeptide (TPR) repeat protein